MKINITGLQPKKINIIDKPKPAISPEEFAKAIGAEIMSEEEVAEWVSKDKFRKYLSPLGVIWAKNLERQEEKAKHEQQ